MSTFISKGGKWSPAKEKIGLVNKSEVDIKYNGQTIKPGEPFIYDGPDREAIRVLAEAGESHLGKDFRQDPDFLQAVRNMNFNSVDEYLKHIGYDEKKENDRFDKLSHEVKAHEVPKRNKEIKAMGGGKDFTGNKENDIIGGFGDERTRSPKELKK